MKKIVAYILITIALFQIAFVCSSCQSIKAETNLSASDSVKAVEETTGISFIYRDIKYDKNRNDDAFEKLSLYKNDEPMIRNVVSIYSDKLDSLISANTISKKEWIDLFVRIFELSEEVTKSSDDTFCCDGEFNLAKDYGMFIEESFKKNPYEGILKKDAADTIVLYLGYNEKEFDTEDDANIMAFQTNLQTALYYHYFEVDEKGYSNPYDVVSIDEYNNILNDLKKLKMFRGKTVYGIGDSIMHGNGNYQNGIIDLLAEKYMMKFQDFSYGGASFSQENDRDEIFRQVELATQMNTVPDYILVNGGTNDMKINNIGAMMPQDDFDYVSNGYGSYAQGIEYTFGLLKEHFPSVTTLFIRCHNMAYFTEEKQNQYGELALKICDKWGIPYLDLYNECGFTRDKDLVKKYTLKSSIFKNGDSIHPSQEMYMIYYIPFISDKMYELSSDKLAGNKYVWRVSTPLEA